MMSIIGFIRMFEDEHPEVKIIFEWYWLDDGIDEEYSFEGVPEEFLDKYTIEYDCLDAYYLDDLSEFSFDRRDNKLYMRLDEY